MRRINVPLGLLAVLTACAILTPTALAAQTRVVADCNSHGRLTGQYSVLQLRDALSTMPPDIKEYTNCYDVIQRALLAQLGGLHQGATGGSSQGSGGSFLPTPLIVVLVALALGAAGFGAAAVRRRGGGRGSS